MKKQMIKSLAPSVLPEISRSKNEFTTHAVTKRPIKSLDAFKIADALAQSDQVQLVTGMGYDELVRRLSTEYRFERSRRGEWSHCSCLVD